MAAMSAIIEIRDGAPRPRELASEAIAVKVRWLGVFVGVVIVELQAAASAAQGNVAALRLLLALGALYAVVDTSFSLRGKVLLREAPLAISLLEALFIGLLCQFDFGRGSESLFRFYYVLSLVSCAIRYDRRTTYFTCLLHLASYGTVAAFEWLRGAGFTWSIPLTLLAMLWVTWASAAFAELLKQASRHLQELNEELRRHQAQLEDRMAQRTRELQEAQASLLHQEKMAAFGLLAAGIAHEVGNPLASISSLVQMLVRHHDDTYTQEKLSLVSGQLTRIQGTLRKLVDFSRPATRAISRVEIRSVLDEALSIAGYYKRTKSKTIALEVEPAVPPVWAVRDQLVQVFLNLVLNAIDATDKDGHIVLHARTVDGQLEVSVCDDGHGIRPEDAARIFQPHYTTKENGTGLGLFVSRKIVADLGGTIRFDSTPDGGTTFAVRLPVDSRDTSDADARLERARSGAP
jgi:signal transduction histidine kinase